MQVELGQLDRRYEGLRSRSAARERKLLASLSEIRDVRAMPRYIPRIARALNADEDYVWDMFVHYVRGVDERWRA